MLNDKAFETAVFFEGLKRYYPKTVDKMGALDKVALLFSREILSLPRKVLSQAEQAIRAFYDLSLSPDYQSLRLANSKIDPELAAAVEKKQHSSVLMAYDFHLDEEQNLKLIEINTNASGFLFADLIEKARGKTSDEPRQKLLLAFKKDFALSRPGQPLSHVGLVDTDLLSQKMYVEFLLYQEWLEAEGIACSVFDATQLRVENQKVLAPSGKSIDLIYNRTTDFLLNSPELLALRKAYLEELCCITPQPKEYVYLADKQALIDLSAPGTLDRVLPDDAKAGALKEVLTPTYSIEALNPDELWEQRKHYFFKPKNAFGGKSAYRGASLTRKVFARALDEGFLVQKFVPAPDWGEWRYDIRFYVYQDEIQLVIARLYQGQVTNFSTPGGGFAAVQFV